jgi:glycolate oxidase FAD binding subunit
MTQPTLVRLEPRTAAEAAAAMAQAYAAGQRLGFAGGGTHAAPQADTPDAVLSTLGLDRVVEYAAEDQTVTVEAGMTVAALGSVLAQSNQRLVLDVAQPERTTVGGAIASNAFGPRRMRYGSLKDMILGVALVRADGLPARAGGKVVKNVAGFDLSKLVVGSFGTLALVTSATLRVYPLPEKTRAVRARGLSAQATFALVLAIRARQLEPAAMLALRGPEDGRYTVDVLFEGFAAGTEAQMAALLELAAASDLRAEEIDWSIAAETDRQVRCGGPLRLRCMARASELPEIDRVVIEPLTRTLDEGAAAVYPALGLTFVAGRTRDAAALAEKLLVARAELEGRGGSLVIEALPAGMPRIDTWGTPPPSLPLMRQLKARFDPQGRLNPGCFVGGM